MSNRLQRLFDERGVFPIRTQHPLIAIIVLANKVTETAVNQQFVGGEELPHPLLSPRLVLPESVIRCGKEDSNLHVNKQKPRSAVFDQDGLRSMQAITLPSCASSNFSGVEDSGGKAFSSKFNLI